MYWCMQIILVIDVVAPNSRRTPNTCGVMLGTNDCDVYLVAVGRHQSITTY